MWELCSRINSEEGAAPRLQGLFVPPSMVVPIKVNRGGQQADLNGSLCLICDFLLILIFLHLFHKVSFSMAHPAYTTVILLYYFLRPTACTTMILGELRLKWTQLVHSAQENSAKNED